MKASTAAVLRSVPQPFDSDVFREEAAKRLSHALHQLSGLNFVSLFISNDCHGPSQLLYRRTGPQMARKSGVHRNHDETDSRVRRSASRERRGEQSQCIIYVFATEPHVVRYPLYLYLP